MKNGLFYLILIVFCLFVNCDKNNKMYNDSNILDDIKYLDNKLINAKSKQEEYKVLDEIWELSYHKNKMNISICIIENNSNNIYDFSKSKGKIKVVITLNSIDKILLNGDKIINKWEYNIIFAPLDKENIYLLDNV